MLLRQPTPSMAAASLVLRRGGTPRSLNSRATAQGLDHMSKNDKDGSSQTLIFRTVEDKVWCALSRLRCHGHSLLLSSYLFRIGRSETKTNGGCLVAVRGLPHSFKSDSKRQPLRPSIPAACWTSLDNWRWCGVSQNTGSTIITSPPPPPTTT